MPEIGLWALRNGTRRFVRRCPEKEKGVFGPGNPEGLLPDALNSLVFSSAYVIIGRLFQSVKGKK